MHPSWAHLLATRAADRPAKTSFLLTGADADRPLSYAELYRRSAAVAARLQQLSSSGDRVLLVLPWGEDFIVGLYACLMAGRVAVPTPFSGGRRSYQRLEHIAHDSGATIALASGDAPIVAAAWQSRLLHVRVDAIQPDEGLSVKFPERSHGPAVIQYTSGSLSNPKGVIITHDNIRANSIAITQAFGVREDDTIVSWLPLYHDMGLFGTVVQTVTTGASAVLLSPGAFVKSPLRWLEEISRRRATISGGPNSAFLLCLAAVEARGVSAELDLSSWEVAFNGAELVEADTLQRFADVFGPVGFSAEAFAPCYGLAEATLLASGAGRRKRRPIILPLSREELRHGRVVPGSTDDVRHVVGCGPPGEGTIVIAGGGSPAPGSSVGEIVIRGSSVAHGYLGRAGLSHEVFTNVSDGVRELRTGDLGFMHEGELFVIGRLKATLVVGGRTLHAEDLETTVRHAHPHAANAAVIAIAVDDERDAGLAILQESGLGSSAIARDLAASTRNAVAKEHGVRAAAVVIVRKGTLPRTTSGKIQRAEAARAFREGTLSELWHLADQPIRLRSPRAGDSPGSADVIAFLAQALAVEADAVRRAPLTTFGVDSLKAIELAQSMREVLAVDCHAALLLSDNTGEAIARLVRSVPTPAPAPEKRGAAEASSRAQVRVSNSPGQEGLWLRSLRNGTADINLLNRAFEFHDISAERLGRAVEHVAMRHVELSATAVDDGRVEWAASPRRTDVRIHAATSSDVEVEEELRAVAQRPFQAGDPLFRVNLWPRPGGVVALFSTSHLIADLWSMVTLLREIGEALQGHVSGGVGQDATYRTFVDEQQQRIGGDYGAAAVRYWSARLRSLPELPALHTAFRALPASDEQASIEFVDLDEGLSAAIADLATSVGATPYAVCLAALQVVLRRVGRQDDVTITALSSGRWDARWRDVIGCCVTPLLFRMHVGESLTFAEHVKAVATQLSEDYQYSDVPFSSVVSGLGIEAPRAAARAQDVVCAWQAASGLDAETLSAVALNRSSAAIRVGDTAARVIRLGADASEYHFSLMLSNDGRRILGECRYSRERLDDATARGLVEGWRCLLAEGVKHPGYRLSRLSLTGDRRRSRKRRRAPSLATVHEQFLRHVAERPDQPAVIAGTQSLTYAELDRRANRLAALLRQSGIVAESRVAIFTDRSVDLPVAVLAAFKAGAAYVPLEPEWPDARLRQVVEDAQASVVVQSRALTAPWIPPGMTRLWMTDDGTTDCGDEASAAGNLAYVMFTSGSTGRPKGVAIEHRQIAGLIDGCRRLWPVPPGQRWAMSHSLAFDFSVWELWMPLASGGTVVIMRMDVVRDPIAFREHLALSRVNVLSLTPSVFRRVLLDERAKHVPLPALELVVFGGEALRPAILQEWFSEHGDERPSVFNLYGITETTVHVTYHRVRIADALQARSVIGKPLPEMAASVVDVEGHILPEGLPGEIYVSGIGVARGYWGRPDLTADRFIPDSGSSGQRGYRSGDLGCVRDGVLEHLGRADTQVKIRGYRIEPGEIESVLASHPDVHECVVLSRQRENDTELLAFASGSGAAATAVLLKFLRERLPSYMVPADIAWLPALPVTSNGKVDRANLLETYVRHPMCEAPNEPTTETERAVIQIWREILDRTDVSPAGNFFDLGGHSLLLVQTIARMRDELRTDVPVGVFFADPTVHAVAAYIDSVSEVPAEPGFAQGVDGSSTSPLG
jgi:amino acid adenylation domain-containing protein